MRVHRESEFLRTMAVYLHMNEFNLASTTIYTRLGFRFFKTLKWQTDVFCKIHGASPVAMRESFIKGAYLLTQGRACAFYGVLFSIC